MTLEEMRDLLATIASFDGRTIDRRVIEDWHELCHSIPYELARQGVLLWYGMNPGYMRPHDLAGAAASVAGLDRRESVTSRRLQGLQARHVAIDAVMVEPMALERKAD